MKKRIAIIGPQQCGKTFLASMIEAKPYKNKVSQDTLYGQDTIDIPAAYLENRWMYQHLIAIIQNHARAVLLVVGENETRQIYSPGFANMFNVPVIGIITKGKKKKRGCPENVLHDAGIMPPYLYVQISGTDSSMQNDIKTEILRTISERTGGGLCNI